MRCLTLQNTREASLRVVPTNPVAFDDVQSVFSDRGPAARWASGEGSMTAAPMVGGWAASTPGLRQERAGGSPSTAALAQEVTGRMREAQERDRQGVPVPDRAWKLADWLDYWLEHVVSPNRRRATYTLYEMVVRTDLKPALGKYPLTRLSAARVQPSSTASCCWPVDPPGPDYEDGTVVRFDSRYARRTGRAQRRPSGRAAKLGAQPHHSMDSG